MECLKRKQKQEKKADVIKKLKVKGKEHTNQRGKNIPKHVSGTVCGEVPRRQNTFKRFYSVLEDALEIYQMIREKPNVLLLCIKFAIEEMNINFQSSFLKIHAVTPARLRRLQNSLLTLGKSSTAARDRRANRAKQYLPESVYWFTFNKELNIKVSFLRSDTCAQCDIYKQKLNEKNLSEEELPTLTAKRELHLRKADAFFDLKRRFSAKDEAGEIECLTFDFMQNLPFPCISSNPAFMLVSYEKPEHKHLYEEIFSKNDQVKAEATIEADEDDSNSGCEEF
ncbi:hypothetical protein ILUMI_17014 [Ignelater luminosus]|uniref:Uncharacterized protein n=1 Tax=Ignelater luminosus TaxID=2038154 RepID=A0A8K0CMH9_IGNLU|nr:hypothetical protein ILUMI_17014 [Ignelater luminosus]